MQQNLFDPVEKIRSIFEILEALTQFASGIEQNPKQHELEKLLDQAQQDLRDARAFLSREEDVSETSFYKQFAAIFGEEEAEETWAVRNWDTTIVLSDLILVLMDDPELRQNIEQKGFNIEIITILLQEVQLRRITTESSDTSEKSLARLREVIYA